MIALVMQHYPYRPSGENLCVVSLIGSTWPEVGASGNLGAVQCVIRSVFQR